jgi:hypothetical protein
MLARRPAGHRSPSSSGESGRRTRTGPSPCNWRPRKNTSSPPSWRDRVYDLRPSRPSPAELRTQLLPVTAAHCGRHTGGRHPARPRVRELLAPRGNPHLHISCGCSICPGMRVSGRRIMKSINLADLDERLIRYPAGAALPWQTWRSSPSVAKRAGYAIRFRPSLGNTAGVCCHALQFSQAILIP